MNVKNTEVYWLNESMIASGYPMLREPIEDIKKEISENLNVAERRSNILANEKRTGHANFLKGIITQFDLDFTVKAWYEAQRYKFLDFVSSMSTMHRLTQMNMDEVFNEYVDEDLKNKMKNLIAEYNENPSKENKLRVLYNCPMWLRFTARMTTNYMQLRQIYHQRRNHELPDWQEFCDWIETLPHSEWITGNAIPFEDNKRNN